MNTLRWMRVGGDTAFAAGAVLLVLFVAGLATGHGVRRPRELVMPADSRSRKSPRSRAALALRKSATA